MEEAPFDQSSARREATICLVINPIWAPVILLLVAIGSVAAYVMSTIYAPLLGQEWVRLFHFNNEANFPTWFSSSLWLVAAVLALAIYQSHRQRGYQGAAYWAGMVPLFMFLSLDEAARIHETIGALLARRFSGIDTRFTYAWVYFGSGLLLFVGIIYLRFLALLQSRFRVLFCVSAGIFISGAIIVESFGAALESGTLERFPLGQTWTSMIVYEEFLEMVGVILLIYTLLRIATLGKPPYSTYPGRRTAAKHPTSSTGTTVPPNNGARTRYTHRPRN